MSAAIEPAARLVGGARLGGTRWLVPVALLAGLAAIVAARWSATRAGIDPLVVGAAFGLAVSALAVGASGLGRRRGDRSATATRDRFGFVGPALVGVAFGLVLVGIVAAGAAIAGAQLVPGLGRPAAAFAPWVAITILVASAEEALLRGRLFDAIRGVGGVVPAVAITTLAFALMHVPLYGWHVVPLDLAVGLAFAGLRMATGSVAAPAAAHSTADLATWWL